MKLVFWDLEKLNLLGFGCCVWFLFFYYFFSGYTKTELRDHSRYIFREITLTGGRAKQGRSFDNRGGGNLEKYNLSTYVCFRSFRFVLFYFPSTKKAENGDV